MKIENKKVRLFKNFKFVCVKPLNEIVKGAQAIGFSSFEQLYRAGYSIKPLKQATHKRAA